MPPNTKNGSRRQSRRPTHLPILNMGHCVTATSTSPSSSTSSLPSFTDSRKSSPGSPSPAKIHPTMNVFLGSEADALDEQFLKENNIKHVLSIQSWELCTKFSGISYKFINAKDNAEQNLRCHFEEICEYLKFSEQGPFGGRVLVHCQAGISRSATACLAYMMKELNASLETSFDLLRQQRDIVCPNFSFLGQLKRWEQDILVQ